MAFTFLMLGPHTETTRDWGRRLAKEVAEARVVVAETDAAAREAIAEADAAYGVLPASLLANAARLRWLQSPQAAPPAGYYYPELIAHPAVVTNMREIYNDHIGAHIMAFVLAFARDFQTYIPLQLRREWKPKPLDTGIVPLPGATALIVGAGGIGAEAARLAAAFGMRVIATDARRAEAPPGRRRAAQSGGAGWAAGARGFRDPDGAAHAGDRGLHGPRPVSPDETVGVLHQHRARQDDAAR